MKLKHMTVQFNRVPGRAATLYYAVGQEHGKTYESHFLVNDSDVISMDNFQLDTYVTIGLNNGITELTDAEIQRRQQEMSGAVLT